MFGSRLLNMFHPFEFNRAKLALERLQREEGGRLKDALLQPDAPTTWEELSAVHDQSYLNSLKYNSNVTRVLEVPFLNKFPHFMIDRWFLKPALWSVAGSLLAARAAIEHGVCLSLGGGFHHASRSGGEGFCLFTDIAYIIETLRTDGTLTPDRPILYIDLDVHQGNGVSADYSADSNVVLLDVYNKDSYPIFNGKPRHAIDIDVPLPAGVRDGDYLTAVERALAKARDHSSNYQLVIYNAGTDIFEKDRLGGFAISKGGVNKRDSLVWRAAQEMQAPLLVLASVGYSTTSAPLLGDFALELLRG